jgi:hypothetical protein
MTDGARLPQPLRLARRLRRALARDMLSAASGALDAGDHETARRLEALAREGRPAWHLDSAWLRWHAKRVLGPTWWQRLGIGPLARAWRTAREGGMSAA